MSRPEATRDTALDCTLYRSTSNDICPICERKINGQKLRDHLAEHGGGE